MPEWESIEGETPIDPSGLKQPGLVTNRRDLAATEAPNISKAFLKYLASKPSRRSACFDYAWFLQLHREMFGNVWHWAGSPRKHDLNLGISHFQIPDQTSALASDLLSWTGFGHPLLDQAVWLHHRAAYIHPFENGNGRWARLLSNIWLKVNGERVVAWPDNLLGESSEIRGEYLASIRQADGGDFSAFGELHRRFQDV
ncbi:MAG: mobile mystery protein B [Planctomycetes bacterium]|nr:mobile mystery protein B [Planctomycetota bacterium]